MSTAPPSAVRSPGRLALGGVTITWDSRYAFPIIAHPTADGWYQTQCEVTYSYGTHSQAVPSGFSFDGASIPWFVRVVPGFAAHDWHLLACCIHDFICEHPEVLPRPVGDGIFVSVMLALANHRIEQAETKREVISKTLQAWLMYVAVACYTIYRAAHGGEVQT